MIRVGVVMGGDSSEREVSILSGKEFIKNLNRDKYQVVSILIDQPKDILAWSGKLDVALLALHGKNGEDGKVQALLEALDIPYSGSGITSSAICIDKNMSKLIMTSVGILTPRWVILRKDIQWHEEFFAGLRFPVIVKPNQGGSSIGISLAETYEDLPNAIDEALLYDDEVIVEEWIQGEEITCSMINGEIIPVLSIQPNTTYYDFDAKYRENDHIQKVALLDDDIIELLKARAIQCWHLFKLKSYARIDMMIQDGRIYVIEINTLPGMTRFSHLPRSARAMGVSYGEVLDRIIEEALERRR